MPTAFTPVHALIGGAMIGLARLFSRSLAAVGVFMGLGAVSVLVLRHVVGAIP